MSEFHEGRVAATFQVGARLEDAKETYEKEIVTIEGAKGALMASLKALDDYRTQIQDAGVQAKVPIKEADIGLKHVVECINILQKMLREVEAKRVAALGAVDALKKVVADTKRLWDEEQVKLKQILEFESQSPKDLRARPKGYMPKENPLELAQQVTNQKLEQSPVSAKRGKKA